MKPLGPTFHRSFPLQRSVLAAYLVATEQIGRPLTAAEARSQAGLGSMKVPAALGYGRATGLLDMSGELTALGKVIVHADSALMQPASLWALHCGLSGCSRAAPTFWRRLWEVTQVGVEVDRTHLSSEVQRSYASGYVSVDSAKVCATAFVSSYAQSDCLGDLGLLERTKNGVTALSAPAEPSLGAFALAVAERWEQLRGDQLSTSMDDFIRDAELPQLFRITKGTTIALLEAIQNRGDIVLHRSAPPFQIARRWNDPVEVTLRLYDN
jgi:hypothetical protein